MEKYFEMKITNKNLRVKICFLETRITIFQLEVMAKSAFIHTAVASNLKRGSGVANFQVSVVPKELMSERINVSE